MKKDRASIFGPLILILTGIAINLVCSNWALRIELPLYLDSIGTIFVSVVGGALPGIIVGFFSNYINSINNDITLYYSLISILIAVVAAMLANYRVFQRLWTALLSGPIFALIGGGLGSVLTWLLYGLQVGAEISQPFVLALIQRYHFDPFMAQLTGDFALDLVDKTVSVLTVFILLQIIPQSLLRKASPIYLSLLNSHQRIWYQEDINRDLPRKDIKCRIISIRKRITLMLGITVAVVSIASLAIATALYRDNMEYHFIRLAASVISLMRNEVDGDEVVHYTETWRKDARYLEIEQNLYNIKNSIPDIEYMYIYQIEENGCRAIFDLDTPDTPGNELGAGIEFTPEFFPFLPDLMAGKPIEPVISNDVYGWLLTVYEPLQTSAGETIAYLAVDLDMEDVVMDRMSFMIRMISLSFGISILLIFFGMYFSQIKFVNPINELTAASEKFAYDSDMNRIANIVQLQKLHIKTGDEIENLYEAIYKTTEDVSEYIDLVDEQTKEISNKASEIQKLQNNIIISFANMVENRDENTGGHIERTAAYVTAICEKLYQDGFYNDILTDEYRDDIEKSAPLHDIGKIKIPDAILNKPGKLTREEFDIIKTHTSEGEVILQNVLKGITGSNYLDQAILMAGSHHEKWDGSGYPNGLKGTDIPLCARIMALADVFDALVSKRCYKDPFSVDEAFNIIRENSGTHFDPLIVEVFLSIEPQIRAICSTGTYAETTQEKIKSVHRQL